MTQPVAILVAVALTFMVAAGAAITPAGTASNGHASARGLVGTWTQTVNLPAPAAAAFAPGVQPGRHAGRRRTSPGHADADVLDLEAHGRPAVRGHGRAFHLQSGNGPVPGQPEDQSHDRARTRRAVLRDRCESDDVRPVGQRRRDVQRESIRPADAARADSRSTVETEAARTKGPAWRGLSDLSSHLVKKHVVILGAGFGAWSWLRDYPTRLRRTSAYAHRPERFVQLRVSKLDVLLGRKTAAEVMLHYRDIAKVGVEFRQEQVESIDPERRRVTTDSGSYDADVLAVALGADYDFAATPDSRRWPGVLLGHGCGANARRPPGLRVGDDSDRDPGPPVQVPTAPFEARFFCTTTSSNGESELMRRSV